MTPSNANTDYAGLIERLDKQHILQSVLGQVTIDGKGFTIFDDAASALRVLLAENARLRAALKELMDDSENQGAWSRARAALTREAKT